MKTYEQIVSEYSSCFIDEKILYLRSLTTEELNLLSDKIIMGQNRHVITYFSLMIDAIIKERMIDDRDNKIHEILGI